MVSVDIAALEWMCCTQRAVRARVASVVAMRDGVNAPVRPSKNLLDNWRMWRDFPREGRSASFFCSRGLGTPACSLDFDRHRLIRDVATKRKLVSRGKINGERYTSDLLSPDYWFLSHEYHPGRSLFDLSSNCNPCFSKNYLSNVIFSLWRAIWFLNTLS